MNGPRPRFPSLVAGALLAAGLLVARPADASLGDAVAARETRATTIATQTLRVRESDGVREYVGKDGKVFAIKWSRRTPPRLDALLGRYLPAYRDALRRPHPSSHSFVLVSSPDLVVAKSMHARQARGSVYLPARMPKGVTIDVLP